MLKKAILSLFLVTSMTGKAATLEEAHTFLKKTGVIKNEKERLDEKSEALKKELIFLWKHYPEKTIPSEQKKKLIKDGLRKIHTEIMKKYAAFYAGPKFKEYISILEKEIANSFSQEELTFLSRYYTDKEMIKIMQKLSEIEFEEVERARMNVLDKVAGDLSELEEFYKKPDGCRPSTNEQDINMKIEGFCVVFTGKGLPGNDPFHAELLNFLKKQLSDLASRSPELVRIKDYSTIWVTNTAKSPNIMLAGHFPSHPSNKEMSLSIEIESTSVLLKSTVKELQPLAFFNAISRIYMGLFLENKKSKIEEVYKLAMSNKLYDKVEYLHGKDQRKADAAESPIRYFAELTEAYYGANDFYPYTRDELQKHDPAGYQLLSEIYK